MNIKLHIDTIALNGIRFSPHRQAEFRASLSKELSRLLGERKMGDWEKQRSYSVIQAAPIDKNAHNDASQLGQQVAQRIYTGLSS